MRMIPLLAAVCCLSSVAVAGDIVLTPAATEIVLAPKAPRATAFAAQELKGFLGRIFGADVPIVGSPSDGRLSIVLGTNAWSAAAGIDVAAKPRDTFVIRAAGGRLYIAGLDSDSDVGSLVKLGRPTDLRSLKRSARATVFGVYEFLERFAGCRFYFPGEMGEIVPRAARIAVPEGTDIVRSPRFTQRSVSLNGGASGPDQVLNWVRLRLETDHIQCGHGLNAFDYARRFADTHPEYFCLKADGTRATLKTDPSPQSQSHCVGQLCHTSKVWDEIAEDVLSYFRGESAMRRTGRPYWQKNCCGDHVDIMPQDGMWKCHCDACQAAYDTDLGRNYANTLIWRHTAEVARKVTDAGLKGRVAQMAYSPYSAVPDFDLPPNVDVMVATMGPWSLKDERLFVRSAQNVKDWAKKVGHTVWLWTYPGKVNAMDLPAAPQVAPKAWGRYYQRMAPFVFGAFNESESDSFYFNYLNFYVFSRVAWDPSVDVDAIVSEHHRLMYGKGAPAMAKFFDRLEDIWLNELTREDDKTSTGGEPSYSPPGPYKLLTQVYSKKTLQELRALLGQAAAAVEPGGADARRIRFAAERIFQPIWKRAREYQKALDPECEEERRARAVSVQSVPASAKWWCKDAERTVEGDKAVFTVRPGGKGMLGLKSAGVTLKPNTRYRASCYLTTHLNDLPFKEIKKGSGFLFELSEEHGRKRLHRVTGLFGERPRESHGFDFETGDEVGEGGSFAVYMYGVTGTVEMDGLAVMEMGPAGAVRMSAAGDHRLPEKAHVVSDVPGYNSWPMIQAMGTKLVCSYSRDNARPKDGHTIDPGSRDSYVRVSSDGGRTWSSERTVAADPKIGEVNEGIGLDSTGAALLWVRCWGKGRRHELYRTADGVKLEKIASLIPDPFPMQVMDPVSVAGLGLVSPWFAGSYRKDGANSWGLLVSADDGRTWTQRVIESGLSVKEWVTEPSLVDLGKGRLLIVGRCEKNLGNQFQVTSTDNGRTWKKARTNIGDVRESTPSLVYDRTTGLLANYYYHRGARKLKRRVVSADFIFDRADAWPEQEILDTGFETRPHDAGNVKATRLGETDCCAWYSGTPSNSTVVVTIVPKPTGRK